jgi:hypothetical protein
MDPQRGWLDYLEIGLAAIGPVIGLFVGIVLLKLTKQKEMSQWQNQKLIEKRIEIWDKVGPIMNDIYCFCMRIGGWKEQSPPDVISMKRNVDKLVHLSRPYFSDNFFKEYQEFIGVCFEVFQGYGENAKLKTPLWEHKNARPHWDPIWDKCFHNSATIESSFVEKYERLINQVQIDLSPSN